MVVVSKQLVLLYDLFKIMLKKLDNMIVDMVFCMIGYVCFNVFGIWWVGLDVVCQILRQQVGVDIGNIIIVDGLGFLWYNLIVFVIMMQVL